MLHRFALKFKPPQNGHVVPAERYAEALTSIVDALAKSRHTVAPLIASERDWPVSQILESLRFGVGATAPGSVLVPFSFGGSGSGDMHLNGAQIAADFWVRTNEIVSLASTGTIGPLSLSASAAESFVRAASSARAGLCGLELIASKKRSGNDWVTSTDLGGIEDGLRHYADTRRATHPSSTQVVGRLLIMNFDPTTLTIQLADGSKRTFDFPAEMREAVHRLWGQQIVVDLRAAITAEGEIRGGKAIDVHAVGQSTPGEIWKAFGSAKDVWGTDAAALYLAQLRKNQPQ